MDSPVQEGLSPEELKKRRRKQKQMFETMNVPVETKPNSRVGRMGVIIVALRNTGMTDQEIADQLGYKLATIRGYVYKANEGGWLDMPTIKDSIRANLLPKVVRNLHDALDSQGRLTSGMEEKTAVALKIAEGTVFKEFDQPAPQVQQTAIKLEVIVPDGPRQQIREDTVGGVPAYVDAEPVG